MKTSSEKTAYLKLQADLKPEIIMRSALAAVTALVFVQLAAGAAHS
jgi:hypothetical protein